MEEVGDKDIEAMPRALTLQLDHKTNNNNKCILYSKAVKISQFIDID